jgi:hypothetical protein
VEDGVCFDDESDCVEQTEDDGWVWTAADGAVPLIQPDSGFAFDPETDGHDLV